VTIIKKGRMKKKLQQEKEKRNEREKDITFLFDNLGNNTDK
jgi:hypothetical protein